MGQTLSRAPAVSDILFAHLWCSILDEAAGRLTEEETDSCCRQKSICWQRWEPSSQLPLALLASLPAPAERAVICSDAQVRAGAPAPLPSAGWVVAGGPLKPQQQLMEVEEQAPTGSFICFPVLKTDSPFLRSQAERLTAHDPDRAFIMQTFLLRPATSQKSMEDLYVGDLGPPSLCS